MNRRLPIFTVVALTSALLFAGCGGSNSSGSTGGYGASTETSGTASETAGQGTIAVVSSASAPKLGRILVDAKGFTLYDFHMDKGVKSSCYGSCAQVWPPLTSGGSPRADGGAEAAKLGTTRRKDGTTQVTYAGHPLYTYTADSKPGDVNGNDFSSFGAQWYALLPSGEEAGD